MPADLSHPPKNEVSARNTADLTAVPQTPKWRPLLSLLTILGGSALWIVTLIQINATSAGLPWYGTITAIAVLCAIKAWRATVTADSLPLTIGPKTARQEPLSLFESWSLTFCLTALILFAYVNARLAAPHKVERSLTRYVDIQLVSQADFTDKNSPLPGMQEQKELHKRQADKVSQQGQLTPNRRQTAAKQTAPAAQKIADSKPQKRQMLETKPQPFTKQPANSQPQVLRQISTNSPASQQQKPAPPTKQPAKATANSSQPFFEEVQAPELVELMENDGSQTATKVFTSGGRSQGGSGAANSLSIYIKELHRKIKSNWSPPRGQSRQAKVLFRIAHIGKLSFFKIIASSGDDDTDVAAVDAIKAAVAGKALPADYALPYLDVEYTFNYTAQEIKEVR